MLIRCEDSNRQSHKQQIRYHMQDFESKYQQGLLLHLGISSSSSSFLNIREFCDKEETNENVEQTSDNLMPTNHISVVNHQNDPVHIHKKKMCMQRILRDRGTTAPSNCVSKLM